MKALTLLGIGALCASISMGTGIAKKAADNMAPSQHVVHAVQYHPRAPVYESNETRVKRLMGGRGTHELADFVYDHAGDPSVRARRDAIFGRLYNAMEDSTMPRYNGCQDYGNMEASAIRRLGKGYAKAAIAGLEARGGRCGTGHMIKILERTE